MKSFEEWLQSEGFWGGFTRGAALGAGLMGTASFSPKPSPQPIAKPVAVTSKKQATVSTPTSKPSPNTRATNISAEIKYIGDYIAKSEGKRSRIYDDGVGNSTIGIGHMLTPESDSIFNNLFNKEIEISKIKAGTQRLTDEQIYELFSYDLWKHMKRAKKLMPQIDTYPVYVKAALIDAMYRGDLGSRTIVLINNNQWQEAAKEYLNHKQYKNRESLGVRGIGPRMERNRDMMLKYAHE